MRIDLVAGVLAGASFFASLFACDIAQADQNNLLVCIKQYTTIGVSADAALAECKKSSLADCVQKLMGQKYQASSIKYVKPGSPDAKETDVGYLIDLGNTESRWLEGRQWKEKGCFAYTQGPYKRQSDRNSTFWSTQRSYEWFRQGWCQEATITLEQPYSLEEAKLRCEVGVISGASLPANSETKSKQ